MRALTEMEYKNLIENYSDALTLAKQTMLANGIDDLIPLYEDLTMTKINPNCTDCRLDMMIILYLAVDTYEKQLVENKPKLKTK